MDIDFLAQEIQNIFKENNIKSKNVACALSSYSVISKKITMPLMEEDALENMISVEVENAIPFPMKDIYYTYSVIGPDHGKAKHDECEDSSGKKGDRRCVYSHI